MDEVGAERAAVEVEGAEAGAGKDEVGVDGAAVEVEGAGVGRAEDSGASDLLPLVF